MAETIPCSPQFAKQLRRLERAGKKAEKAVATAERIIRQLARSTGPSAYLLSKQTKNGENRLNHIEKYDLGAGYRLICRRTNSRVILEFIGSHDQSDLWLNHRRDATADTAAYPPGPAITITVPPAKEPAAADSRTPAAAGEDPYEDQLSRRLDEQTLLQVFSGFLNNARNRS